MITLWLLFVVLMCAVLFVKISRDDQLWTDTATDEAWQAGFEKIARARMYRAEAEARRARAERLAY